MIWIWAGRHKFMVGNILSIRTYIILTLLVLGGPIYAQAADKPSAREIEICLQTIRDLTDGNPPKRAIALCQQGKLDAAIDEAMSNK